MGTRLRTLALAAVVCSASAASAQTEADPAAWPSVARVRLFAPSTGTFAHSFSGVVVAPQWVLTTAVIVDHVPLENLAVEVDGTVLPVVSVKFPIAPFAWPFVSGEYTQGNLVLLGLGLPTSVPPVLLPSPPESFAGHSVTAVWHDHVSCALYEETGVGQTVAHTQALYAGVENTYITDEHLGVDGLAQGYYPLFASQSGTTVLAGMASFGAVPDVYPEVFTRITEHLDWIHATIAGTPSGPCTPSWIPTFGQQLDGTVRALTIFDDGSGPALYAGGDFTTADGVVVNHIAKWNGTSWVPLASGVDSSVQALAVVDEVGGAALYAAGWFTTAGGVAANYVAKWDGAGWSALGAGLNAPAYALTGFDDGNGAALYAGGLFNSAGGAPAAFIAKWDGAGWSEVGGGVNQGGMLVNALTVFDDGSGPALFVGGGFWTAGGSAMTNIAKWDGSNWSALGGGTDGTVDALTIHDDGSGPALYAGGSFTNAGGVFVKHIAKWNGTTWSGVGGEVAGGFVTALTTFDDGNGNALYAGGSFATAGGSPASRIAKWDGTNWSPLGSGMSTGIGSLYSLIGFDDGSGPALYAGSHFTAVDSGDTYLARWGCPASVSTCQTDLGYGNTPSLGFSICGGDLSSGTFAILSLTGIPSGATPFLIGSSTSTIPPGPFQLVAIPPLFVIPFPPATCDTISLKISGGGGPGSACLQFAVSTRGLIRTSNALRIDVLP